MSEIPAYPSGFVPLFSGPDRLRGPASFGAGFPGPAGLSWPRGGKSIPAAERPPLAEPGPALPPESIGPIEAAEPLEVRRPPIRLVRPRWLESEGSLGGTLTMRVEAEPAGDPATRVIFRPSLAWEGGSMDLPAVEGHIDSASGAAVAVAALPDGLRDARSGRNVAQARARFTARHSRSEAVSSGSVPVGEDRAPPFEGMLFYSPARDAYLLIVGEEDFRPLWRDILGVEGLRDKARAAWRNPDPGARVTALGDLERETEALLGKGGADPRRGALEELLLVRGNRRWGDVKPWVYIPAHERSQGQVHVRGHWREGRDATVRKQLDLLLHPRGEKLASPFLNTRYRANLFEGRRKPGEPWKWKAGAGGNDSFSWSSEAALGRFFAGWDGADASWDPRKRALKLGAAGNAGFALFEGKAELALDLPGREGVDILDWLGRVKGRDRRREDPGSKARACLLKARVEGSLSAFAGLSVYGTLALAGNPPRSGADGEASAGAEAGAFLGARGTIAARTGLHWSPSAQAPFAPLAVIRYGAGLSAGIAGEAKLRVEYAQGALRFRMSAAAGLGLGFKLEQGFDVGMKEGFRLLGHLFDCLDFHFVAAVARDAFDAYRDHVFALLTAPRRAGPAGEAGEAEIRAKRALEARIGERSLLRQSPPEALGRALALVLRAREPGDFRTLRYLLDSTVRPGARPETDPSANHKLKWTLRIASGAAIPFGPAREAAKAGALRAGIALLRDFAAARGRWSGSASLPGEAAFAEWLERFLAENGLPG